ncbi:MAG: hypothetical protein F6K36_30525, partial [Symploca sp. SIO3C6]|nr:hypothetical protein [Symploca sp. SIO3C6]
MGNETLDAPDSQGFINDPKGQVDQQFGDRQTANTGGGDYAGDTVDKRQNTFNFYLFGPDPTTS